MKKAYYDVPHELIASAWQQIADTITLFNPKAPLTCECGFTADLIEWEYNPGVKGVFCPKCKLFNKSPEIPDIDTILKPIECK